MKMAIKRALSWLLTGASVLLVPKIVYWLYYWYFYLTGLFADAFPRIGAVFAFLDDFVEEMAGAGFCGLLVTLLIYGVCSLTITASEKLHPSVLGGHFLAAGILSLWLIARNGFALWTLLHEAGLRDGIRSFQGVLLILTLVAQIVYTSVIFEAFGAMGSLELLFGNKKRIVFVTMPKDAHDTFSAFAYVPDAGGLMGRDGKPDNATVNACLSRAVKAGVLASHGDCLLCDASLVRKDTVQLKDVMQVHEEMGQVFFNPNTPFCELLRIGTKGGILFCSLGDARKL